MKAKKQSESASKNYYPIVDDPLDNSKVPSREELDKWYDEMVINIPKNSIIESFHMAMTEEQLMRGRK
jgi:hypothetical protein